MNAPVLDLDLSTATVPVDFGEVEAAFTSPENGIPYLRLERVAIRPGPRRADSASAETILTLCVELLAVQHTEPTETPHRRDDGGRWRWQRGSSGEAPKARFSPHPRGISLTMPSPRPQPPSHRGRSSCSSIRACSRISGSGGPAAPPAAPDDGGATSEEPPTNDSPRKRGVDELSDASGIMAETRSLAESLGQGSGRAPSEEQPPTYTSSKDKSKATFATFLTTTSSCERLRTMSQEQDTCVLDILRILSELLRIASVDPSLERKRAFIAQLEAGVAHSLGGGRADIAATFVHKELMSSSEDGRKVNMPEIFKLRDINKLLGSPKIAAPPSASCEGPMPPLHLAPNFPPYTGPPARPSGPALGGPSFGPGVAGHYAPQRGRSRGAVDPVEEAEVGVDAKPCATTAAGPGSPAPILLIASGTARLL
ncbi:unnamed protein product [Scytosiphon promiscuus]